MSVKDLLLAANSSILLRSLLDLLAGRVPFVAQEEFCLGPRGVPEW